MEQTGPTIGTIIRVVASIAAVTTVDIRSDRRDKHLALARHIAMWIARREALMSYPSIGQAIGRRDHTTVIHGVQRIDRLMRQDRAFADQVLAVVGMVNEETAAEAASLERLVQEDYLRAKRALAKEIAAVQRESPRVPPFKPGPLEW
jgi:hypothetical protein